MGRNLVFSSTVELLSVTSDALVFVKADGNYSSITMADGSVYVLTQLLGNIEKKIFENREEGGSKFIRIGKSLIINRDYITLINPARQKMVLSDCRSFRHELAASKEALKKLKTLIESYES